MDQVDLSSSETDPKAAQAPASASAQMPPRKSGWVKFKTACVWTMAAVVFAAFGRFVLPMIPLSELGLGDGKKVQAEIDRAPASLRAKSDDKSFIEGLIHPVKKAWTSAHHKIESLHYAQEQNVKLRLENANLRLQAESLQMDCRASAASLHAKQSKLELDEEAWAAVARLKQSIRYEVPTHLLPPQLYVLAVSYFKAGEDEKSALLLTHLTGMKDLKAYQTAKDYLMTAVAWYRIDNLKVADHYFDKVLKMEKAPENLQLQAQARLWRALISERTNRHMTAQFWLRELVDHHPHSMEARWVNPQEATGARRPAARKASH